MDQFQGLRKQLDEQLKDLENPNYGTFDKAVVALFSTPRGKEVLKGFRELWLDTMIFDENPYRMAYKAGLADFVNFISDTIKAYERGRQ